MFLIAMSIILPEDISTYIGLIVGIVLIVFRIISNRKTNISGAAA
jgi:hypothetical protein